MSADLPVAAPDAPTTFGPYERAWKRRDCIIYALGVGAGTDELQYATDTTASHPQRVIPTFMINQGLGGRGFRQEWIGNPKRTVHAGHRLAVHSTIPVTGSIATEGRVVEVVSKGSGRLVTVEWESRDRESATIVCTNTVSYFVREPHPDGLTEPSRYELGRKVPDGPATVVVQEKTAPTQALLYRCSGDPNVIHTDPDVARAVGFNAPILHGLCTLGFAARAVLKEVCGGDTYRFRGIECRFANPGYPGDTLVTSIWVTSEGAAFRTCNHDGTVLIDRGFVTLFGGSS